MNKNTSHAFAPVTHSPEFVSAFGNEGVITKRMYELVNLRYLKASEGRTAEAIAASRNLLLAAQQAYDRLTRTGGHKELDYQRCSERQG